MRDTGGRHGGTQVSEHSGENRQMKMNGRKRAIYSYTERG